MDNKFSDLQRAILALHLVQDLGPLRFRSLVSHFGDAQKVSQASVEEIAMVQGISKKLAISIAGSFDSDNVEKEIEKAEHIGADIITYVDERYPQRLKDISDCPPVIYVRGKLKKEDDLSVAVVGTRKCTPYGLSVTQHFVRGFAEEGITVISGLARGIDKEAHEAALKHGGRTIAVLGNGLGHHYPPEHKSLEDKIVSNGALISEFPVGARPDKINFPRRNRLISALSLSTLVIEADIKSGALITAQCALEQGKDVFAVPGPVTSQYSKGPNYLIKSGAQLAEYPEDVIESLRMFSGFFLLGSKSRKKVSPVLNENSSGDGSELIQFLQTCPQGARIDEIIEKVKAPAHEVSAQLMTLELEGLVKSLPGSVYIKVIS